MGPKCAGAIVGRGGGPHSSGYLVLQHLLRLFFVHIQDILQTLLIGCHWTEALLGQLPCHFIPHLT